MTRLLRTLPALCAAVFVVSAGHAAFGQDCVSVLEDLEQTLDQSNIMTDQMDTLRGDLVEARQLANAGDDEGCSAAAAKLQSAMLQIEDMDHDSLCNRAQSEAEIGEADMAGNQDVQAALQSGCDYKP